MKLTAIECERATPRRAVTKLSDGNGLQLWVQLPRGKYWRFAYKHAGKQKVLAIGPYPAVTLDQARQAAVRARGHLAEGKDPAELKRAEKERIAARAVTFRDIGDEYIARLRKEGRAASTVSKTEWLLSFAYPHIGDRPIIEIKPAHVLEALRKVEARGRLESARRLRSTIGSVFRYAIASARAEIDPTTALQRALLTPNVKTRAAITDPKALGGLLRAIESFDGQPTVRAALQLMPILFPRPGELRLSEWSEFDFDKAVWIIPAAKMKMRRPHRVPLPRQAIEILQALRQVSEGALAFPGLRAPDRAISDGTMIAALRRMGYGVDEVCPHGFRATASTLLNESGKWHPDAIERQLAHIESNDARRAYARGEHWEERVRMMTWWADYLYALKANDVRMMATMAGPEPTYSPAAESPRAMAPTLITTSIPTDLQVPVTNTSFVASITPPSLSAIPIGGFSISGGPIEVPSAPNAAPSASRPPCAE